jgi:hypothetical protein
MHFQYKIGKSFVFVATALLPLLPAKLHAQATLLLEEPYSYDGNFAGTGHTAVYLSRVCADSPIVLRRCHAGESGVVISRYHRVAAHDWIAIPLIPYLYAVDRPEDVPLFANRKSVSFLRANYLQKLGIDDPDAYQLIGSSYDRTSYGFRIDTTPEQDDELISVLNSAPNQEAYKLLNRNCADFVKQIINFYYPHAIHRSVIADLGVTTPKQSAKSLSHFAKHHPKMRLTTFIIPQVPGLKRSKPAHGVLESLVLAKKYVTPVLLFHPFLVGTAEVAYWAGWRFDPAKGATIFDPAAVAGGHDLNASLEAPLPKSERNSYKELVESVKREAGEDEATNWAKLQEDAEPQLDAEGRPFLRVTSDERTYEVGLSRGNMLRLDSPPEFTQQLLLSRLQQELKPSKPTHVSVRQVKADWEILQRAGEARRAALTAQR